jgi:hypothetical protein
LRLFRQKKMTTTNKKCLLMIGQAVLLALLFCLSPRIHADDELIFYPVVAFSSRQTHITSEQLQRIYAGEYDADLLLSDAFDYPALHPFIRTIPADQLNARLWANPDAYTLLPLEALTPRSRVLWVDGFSPLEDERLTRILFSGVTALARQTREVIEENGVEWAGSGIRDIVQDADFFHISNEVSFAPRCPQSDEPVLGGLCAVDAHFELLTMLDVDIVELSGNHNNDYGYNVYRRTLEMYEQAGMMTVAGGRTLDEARQPLIIEHNGSSVALVSCNWNGPDFALVNHERPGAAYCVLGWLGEVIPQLKAQYDVVIVTVQYAEYDRYQPIERQVNHFRQIADMGADVVLGTQAHQPQTFEFYTTPDEREVLFHYGMGNLFFDQTSWEKVRFFMDEVLIVDGRFVGMMLHTGIIEDLARPRWMTDDERIEFLDLMFRYSGWGSVE